MEQTNEERPLRSFWSKLARLDRRIVYALIILSVIVPFVTKMVMNIRVSTPVRKAYKAMDELEPGQIVIVSIDYNPSTIPELQPMLHAILRHSFNKDLKVILMSLRPLGPPLGHMAMDEMTKEYDLKYGEDYLFIDYRPGERAVILAMGRDIKSIYGSDYMGTPLDSFLITREVTNFDDIALVVDLASSSSSDWWPQIAHARYGQKLVIGGTAVIAPDSYPYLDSGQIEGLIGGLKGAAEYEMLVNRPDVATVGMPAQSIAHLLIVAFIVVGNVAYFASRRTKA
jgi:hypothetical protein